MLGIVVIDKPQGMTSHDVVNTVRRQLGMKRVGHAGTLDPMATGALVVAVGPATRFLQYLPLEPKSYEGTIQFGVETNSQDAEGEVVAERPVPAELMQAIDKVISNFLGESYQIPPMFSAIKKDGQPLYALARKGVEVERQPRRVYVHEITIREPNGEFVDFEVKCSGGTYVRTLAHDLGNLIGCGAHLTRLRRTSVGKFHIERAVPLSELSSGQLIPLPSALDPMPIVRLNELDATRVSHGGPICLDEFISGPFCGLLSPDNEFLGVARKTGDSLQPECVMPQREIDGSLR